MKKTFIFLIVNFFLISNALAEKNYLYCIETLDKARDHFMNEGEVESAAFIEYDDIKNTIKIHAIWPNAKKKPFYKALCDYLSSGPIIVMILEGENDVLKNRELMGATDPLKAEEGTLRKMYGVSIDKNSVHGSDSIENAKIEIDFFFK